MDMANQDTLDIIINELRDLIIPLHNNIIAVKILKNLKFKPDCVTMDTNNFIDYFERYMNGYRCAQTLYSFLKMFLNNDNVLELISNYENDV